jgi:GLPGLI family protein
MKKISLAVAVFCLFNVVLAKAQKIAEGKLTYEISFPDMEVDEQTKSMMPTESVIYFKDNLMRMEMKMMGMSTVVIGNQKDKSAITLMDMMGNKYAIKMTAEEIEKEKSKVNSPKYDVKLTDETKVIAGYKCKKAIASTKDGNEIVIFYTSEIAAKNQSFNDQYKGVDGFPMEYQMTQNGMNMKLVAKSVSREKVDDSKFTIPPDYKITTKEELAKMFGGH